MIKADGSHGEIGFNGSNDYYDFARQLLARDDFLIVTHKNPDGDTVGSSSALCSALRCAGKAAYLYPNPQFTDKYREYVVPYLAPSDFSPGCIVSTDVSAPDMLAKAFEGDVDFCVDHHPTNPAFGRFNCIHPEMASCSQIILELIEAINGSLSSAEASLLYIGLSTDCDCFQYGNTDEAAHQAAARLIRYGADIYPLNEKFFRMISPARLRLEGMIYSGMEFYRDGAVVFATLTTDMIQKSGAVEDDLDDISSLPGRISTRRISATFREKPDGTTKVSVRTVREYSAAELCREFGGGGHEAAAGCTISGRPDHAKRLFLAVVEKMYPEL